MEALCHLFVKNAEKIHGVKLVQEDIQMYIEKPVIETGVSQYGDDDKMIHYKCLKCNSEWENHLLEKDFDRNNPKQICLTCLAREGEESK